MILMAEGRCAGSWKDELYELETPRLINLKIIFLSPNACG
jgi:hypothetical protein